MDLSTLPTTGGYDGIWTPREIHGQQHGRVVETPEQLLQLHALQLAKFNKPSQWRYIGEPIQAFVSANRWIIRCPHCGGGVSCGPEWEIACCFECGAVFDAIAYPDDWRKLEATLQARPGIPRRNWVVEETHEHLVRENLAHGCEHGAGKEGDAIAEKVRVEQAAIAAAVEADNARRIQAQTEKKAADEEAALAARVQAHVAEALKRSPGGAE